MSGRIFDFIIIVFMLLMKQHEEIMKKQAVSTACRVLFMSADHDASEAVSLPGAVVILGK